MVQKRGQIAIRDLYGAQPFEHSFRWEFLVAKFGKVRTAVSRMKRDNMSNQEKKSSVSR